MQKNNNKMFLSFVPPLARNLEAEFNKDQSAERSREGSRKITKKQLSIEEETPGHRLTLKDYLRLANISKRNNSGSKSRSKVDIQTDRSMVQHDTSISRKQIEENHKNQSTLRSIQLVKEELKQDMLICEERMKVFNQNFEKNKPKFLNSKEAYNELVFLCQLHREIKESVQGGIERANRMLAYHIHDQIYNFIGKTQSFIEEEGIKKRKTPSPARKRNITGTQMVKASGRRSRHNE